MKNIIRKIQEFAYRLFNRKQRWEDILPDYSDYDWDDVTDPIIYFDHIDQKQSPNNVIFAAERFKKG